MKNKEKYKNELMDVIKMDGKICGFMKKHNVYRMIGTDWAGFCETNCIACGTLLQIWLNEEYVEPPKPEVDWSKVPVDTLVRVRDLDNEEWSLMYFKGIDEKDPKYRYMAWTDGATSKTACGYYEKWTYCELFEDEGPTLFE